MKIILTPYHDRFLINIKWIRRNRCFYCGRVHIDTYIDKFIALKFPKINKYRGRYSINMCEEHRDSLFLLELESKL